METDPKSRHLDIPAEANRDKHTNFLAQDNGEIDPGADEFGKLFDDNDDNDDEDVDEED